jgi:hypothetical protein
MMAASFVSVGFVNIRRYFSTKLLKLPIMVGGVR